MDYVILTAYDEHYNGSEESASVSSLPFVKEGVKNVLTKVPAERTVVALPFYTRLWKEVKGKKPHPEAYGMSGAESVVRANDASQKWDEATGQYYAEFKSSGATYKIWLEEETSLKKKLEVVKKSYLDDDSGCRWRMVRLFERKKTYNSTKKDAGVRYVEGKNRTNKESSHGILFCRGCFFECVVHACVTVRKAISQDT